MFSLGTTDRFHIYNGTCDMRKSFDGLCGIVKNELGWDPCSGEVFVFVSKSKDKIKLLHWVGSGFVLYYKRLEKGRFELPRYDESVGAYKISYAQVVMLIDGINITNIKSKERLNQTKDCA